MEQTGEMNGMDAEVQGLIAVLERADETTWSSRIAHALTGTRLEETLPLLRHELGEVRRTSVARKLKIEARLDALIATLNELLVPYGYRPQQLGV